MLQKLRNYFNKALANLHIAVLVPAGGKEQKAYRTGFVPIETVVENPLKKFFPSHSTKKDSQEKEGQERTYLTD